MRTLLIPEHLYGLIQRSAERMIVKGAVVENTDPPEKEWSSQKAAYMEGYTTGVEELSAALFLQSKQLEEAHYDDGTDS